MLASGRAAQFNSGVSSLTRRSMRRQKAARISFNIEGQLLAYSVEKLQGDFVSQRVK